MLGRSEVNFLSFSLNEKIVELATDSIHDLKRARTAHEMVNVRKKSMPLHILIFSHWNILK